MIMKANKQIGFIYKNEESIDKILKDGEVVFERGFLREKASTTLPITFGGVGKDLKDYKIYGNTYQNSTSGKNFTYIEPRTSNGITSFYDKETGKISFSGTPTQQWIGIENKHAVSIPVGTYTLSLKESKSFRIIVRYYTDDTNYEEISISANKKSVTKTFSNNIIATQIWIQLVVGTTYDEEFYLQLEEGSEATEYEPYTGGQPSPNPDYPQEIVSCGDRTKNLFDKDNINVLNAYIGGTSGKITDSNGDKSLYIPVKSNTTYTISKTLSNRFRIGFTDILPTTSQICSPYSLTQDSQTTYTITSGASSKYLVLYYYVTSDTLTEQQILDSIQIEEASTATSYEPYGYKIPINVRSDNLFKVIAKSSNGITSVINSDGSITYSGTATSTWANITASNYIDIEPGEYTFSIDKPLDYKIIIRLYYEDDTFDYAEIYAGNTKRSFTLNRKVKRYYVYIANYLTVGKEYNETLYIQLVKGPTAPSKYIPYYNETTNIYLDEPLRGIGEYSDYIDFINGKVVRKIYEYKITGNENWLKTYGDNLFNIDRIFNDKPFIVGYGLSNMYIYNSVQSGINNNTLNGEFALQKYVGSSDIGYNLFVKNTSYSNKDLFKTYLQNLYNNNTPVIINYPLETPTEESITLPNIPTIDRNNTLNIETEITPSQVYIKYKSNT